MQYSDCLSVLHLEQILIGGIFFDIELRRVKDALYPANMIEFYEIQSHYRFLDTIWSRIVVKFSIAGIYAITSIRYVTYLLRPLRAYPVGANGRDNPPVKSLVIFP